MTTNFIQGMRDFDSFSDSELARAVSNSDGEAFQALYYRYYEKLYYFIWYRMRSTEAARDITQELFSRVWHHRASLDPAKSIKAYLYRIANNLVINQFQKQTIEKKYLNTLEPDRFVATPSENFDLKDKIGRAIDGLPEKPRTVFMLHRFEGFTYAEIAQSLEVSVKTVEKRMSHALKLLREALEAFL